MATTVWEMGSNSARTYKLSRSEISSLTKRGYEIKKKIGQGSFSTVWKVEFTDLEIPGCKPLVLACKLIDRAKLSKKAQAFTRREIEIIAKIFHPYVIAHHSFIERDNKLFIFMRFAENGDVDNFLRTRGYLSESHTRTWMRQVATALNYLHSEGIAHRDLKCSNLLITDKFNLKVADFGFSRFSTDHYGKRVLSETWCGSPAFTAPEIIAGDPYDPFLADCWALGVVMYSMLTASLPFDGTLTPRKLYQQQIDKKYSIHPNIAKDLSAESLRVMQRLIQPEIKYRMNIKALLETDWVKSARTTLSPELIKKASSPVPKPRLSLLQKQGIEPPLKDMPSSQNFFKRSRSRTNTRDCLSSSEEVFSPSKESRYTTSEVKVAVRTPSG